MKISRSQVFLTLSILVTACMPSNLNNINLKDGKININSQIMDNPKSNPYYG